jgi:hypothetical protein
MGPPLSPMVANLLMGYFEECALSSFHLKMQWWLGFVDDTGVNCPHGRENLDRFIEHLNNRLELLRML